MLGSLFLHLVLFSMGKFLAHSRTESSPPKATLHLQLNKTKPPCAAHGLLPSIAFGCQTPIFFQLPIFKEKERDEVLSVHKSVTYHYC